MGETSRCDVKTLERLAVQLRRDAKDMNGLNRSAMCSIAEIISLAIGAPLMWPTREAGAAEADRLFPGDNAARHHFNWGVKWAVEQYHDLNIDQVIQRGTLPQEAKSNG